MMLVVFYMKFSESFDGTPPKTSRLSILSGKIENHAKNTNLTKMQNITSPRMQAPLKKGIIKPITVITGNNYGSN